MSIGIRADILGTMTLKTQETHLETVGGDKVAMQEEQH